jgi:hypothetical protein
MEVIVVRNVFLFGMVDLGGIGENKAPLSLADEFKGSLFCISRILSGKELLYLFDKYLLLDFRHEFDSF